MKGYNVKCHSVGRCLSSRKLIVCCAECTFFSFEGSERINFRLIKVLEYREGFSNQLEEKSGNSKAGFE